MPQKPPDRQRARRRALLLLLVFAALLAFASALNRPEPIYSNQPLSYWVERLADPATSHNAASVINEMGAEAVPALRDALKNNPSALSRATYEVAAWLRLAPPRQYAPEEIRATAAYVLGQLREEAADASDDLAHALADDDAHVRMRASWALSRIGLPAVTSLEQALMSEETVVRYGAAKALGEMGPQARHAVDGLLIRLRDTQPNVRDAAIVALGRIGEKAGKAGPRLVELLKDPNADTRRLAARALGRIGPLPPETQARLDAFLASEESVAGLPTPVSTE